MVERINFLLNELLKALRSETPKDDIEYVKRKDDICNGFLEAMRIVTDEYGKDFTHETEMALNRMKILVRYGDEV